MTTALAAAAELFVDGDWVESKDQDPAGEVRLIQLADIGVGAFLDRSRRFLTAKKAQELRCTYLEPGDILIARMPDPMGRACIFPDLGRPCVTAVDVAILRARRDLDRRYLVHHINAPQFQSEVLKHAKGATRQRISRRNLAALPIQLPPIEAQRALVARIEACMERVDEIDTLRAEGAREARALLPSSLAAVFDDLHSLYESQPLERILSDSRYGTSQRCDASDDATPVLRIPNVVNGQITFEQLKYCELDGDDRERWRLAAGDLLIVRTNGSPDLVGRCAVFEGSGRLYAFASYLIRMRVDPKKADPHFVSFFLTSTYGRDAIAAIRRTSAGQFNVNSENLRSIRVPVPPVTEQKRIAAQLRAQQSAARGITSEQAKRPVEAIDLRTAILRSAFAGEL